MQYFKAISGQIFWQFVNPTELLPWPRNANEKLETPPLILQPGHSILIRRTASMKDLTIGECNTLEEVQSINCDSSTNDYQLYIR